MRRIVSAIGPVEILVSLVVAAPIVYLALRGRAPIGVPWSSWSWCARRSSRALLVVLGAVASVLSGG